MKLFKIDKNATIVCKSESTRYGFRHLATLLINGLEQETAKSCYYNRTWESFEFETVIKGLLFKSKYLSKTKERNFLNRISNRTNQENKQRFNRIANIAKLGEIFSNNQKETNDWKARMIKVGLSDKGLIMPEDWNQLDESTKETRLNAVIGELAK